MQYIWQHALRVSSLAAVISTFVLLILLPHQAHAASITVVMTDNQFTPGNITVNAGDTVTWVNQGASAHTATSDNGAFDSGPIQPGQQFSATFNQPGTYKYHCTYHGGLNGAGMSGSIVINAVAGVGAGYAAPAAPSYTGSPTDTAQLYARVQSLLAQVQALQASGGAGATAYNSSSCPLIGRALKIGSSGDDVTRLQQFLARDPSVYPEGIVSGYFGALTRAAVQRWQTKYNIVSSGSPEATGFGVVGPRTAAAISLLCSTVSGAPSGGTPAAPPGIVTGAPVGGFIQVSPVSGVAPLTVNVTANINTGASCAGAVYILDFGDGTPPQSIPVTSSVPGSCPPQSKTYQHLYLYGGIYQVLLSAGSHTTGTSVTISGPAAPQGAIPGVTGQIRGTISAFTTSGNAPLPVTFYVSCAVGAAYNVVFGDGTDLGSTAVSGTKCGAGGLDAVSHTYARAGAFTARLLIFSQQVNGTVTPATADTISVNVGSVAANYSYNPPQLSPGSGALTFGVQFDLPTACTGYDLSWGDGTADVIQTDGGSSCAQTTTIKNLSHAYAHAGSYTLTLRRGASLGKTDAIAVTVAQ